MVHVQTKHFKEDQVHGTILKDLISSCRIATSGQHEKFMLAQ